ncbi:MAG: ABC transporter permease, partial [Gemmataceae bacterium]
PERWLARIRGLPGVERADPYLLAMNNMTLADGRSENVVLVGCDAASLLGNPWLATASDAAVLRQPDGIIVDECDSDRLGGCRVGSVREIGRHRARIVGLTNGLVSFTTRPYVFTTVQRVRARFGHAIPEGHCSYFLVRVVDGVDKTRLIEQIRSRVPDVDVYDRATYGRMSMVHWLTRTGIGISFGLAAFLGLLVGLAVVAQTLYAGVADRAREYATLLALGATRQEVRTFLLAQALVYAGLGALLGLGLMLVLARLMTTPRAPVLLTWPVALLSVLLVIGVCILAAWLPYCRLRRLDPASVLRG